MTKPENIAILDMEWTSWEGANIRGWSGPGEFPEIVEIGVISITNDETLTEIDALQVYVKPILNPILSKYFIDLTGISQRTVDKKGSTLHDALEKTRCFLGNKVRHIFSHGNDALIIKRNCVRLSIPPLSEHYQFINIQDTIASFIGNNKKNYTSSDLPMLMGFQSPGNAHTAIADCRCVAQAMRIMRRSGKF